MNIRRFVLASVLFFCTAFTCLAQEKTVIEPELQQLLNNAGSEKYSIIIVMKSQAEASAVKAKVAAHRDRGVQRTAVVNEFKAHSNASQISLLTFLRAEEQKGNVANVTPLWIANTVCCDATRDVIVQLAACGEVAIIGCNKEVQMLCNSQEDACLQTAVAARAGVTPHVIQVNASQVWEQGYTGKNVVVAILDSGINDEHTDLKDHLWQGYADTDGDGEADDIIHGWNFTTKDGKGDSDIKDEYGHGTHCAGIICGDGTSGNITGIAPDATLMTLKTINRTGGGSPANMMNAVQFAIENGADILSISSGFKSSQISASEKEALRRTFVNALEAGIVAFVAAGNDGDSYGVPDNVDYPAVCPPPYLHPHQQENAGGLSSVVCVGAVNADDEYASFSSQGPVTWQGTAWNDYLLDETHIGLIRPDICAPGDIIYSLKHDENNKYKINTGTSQATPCVAGVAALMLEKNSTLAPADICRIMENTAKKLSDRKNNLTGSGRVDALAAVDAVEATDGEPYLKLSSFAPEYVAQGADRELRLVVTNSGRGRCSAGAAISFYTTDNSVSTPATPILLGNLASGESKEVVVPIDIAPDVANGHTVYFKAVMTDGEYSWTEEFAFRVKSYAKIMGGVDTSTTVTTGENISLDVDIVNEGNVATTAETELTLKISGKSASYVTFVSDKATLDVIAPGETQVVTFLFNVSEDAPIGTNLQFDLYAVPDNYTESQNLIYGFELHTDQYGYLEDGFEGWTTFDASNDGRKHPWWHSSLFEKHRMQKVGSNYSGKGHAVSESYCMASLMEYTIPVDNYLVSPKFKATAESVFSFKARVHSSGYYGEHFGVAVSENGNSDAASFTTIKEWVINREQGDGWLEFSTDLSEYAGKEIYVAIRHFFTQAEWDASYNGYDFYALHVDDAMFANVIDMSTNFVYDNYSYFSVKVAEGSGEDTAISGIDTGVVVQHCGDAIVVTGALEECVVSVYDICGCEVFKVAGGNGSCLSIDSALFGKGVYLVKVVTPDGVTVRKVILQ